MSAVAKTSVRSLSPAPNTSRKRAQKLYVAKKCTRCRGRTRLQRHHIDRNPANNAPSNVVVLCQKCHTAAHVAEGTWGKGQVKPRACVVCGDVFQPARNRRGKLCGKEQCLVACGRIAAAKRWAKKAPVEVTEHE